MAENINLIPKTFLRQLESNNSQIYDTPSHYWLGFIFLIPAITLMIRYVIHCFRTCTFEYVWEVTDSGQIARRLRRKPWCTRRHIPTTTTTTIRRDRDDDADVHTIRTNHRHNHNSTDRNNTNTSYNSLIEGSFLRSRRNRSIAAATASQQRFQTLLEQINAQRRHHGEAPLSLETLLLILRRSNSDFNPNDYDALWTLQEEQQNNLLNPNGYDWSHCGLTLEEIERLPSRILSETEYKFITQESMGKKLETSQCAVCLDDFNTGDHIRTLPCFHMYHSKCIDCWLQTKAKCPVCKEYAHC